MDFKSKSTVSSLGMNVKNDITGTIHDFYTRSLTNTVIEYVGNATLRIKIPGNSGSCSILHYVDVDVIHSEGHNKAINLMNFPEIDLGGSCMLIPLTIKDVKFEVESHTNNDHKMNIKATIHRAIEPRVVVNNTSIQHNVTERTDVQTWCTIPYQCIPIGTILEIVMSPGIKDKNAVDYIVEFMQAHHVDSISEIKQEVDTIINQTQELTVACMSEGDLLEDDDAIDGSNSSLDSLKANLSPAFPPDKIQIQSTLAVSPVLDATMTPPTNLSIDLSKDDLAFLESIGTVKTVNQRNSPVVKSMVRGGHVNRGHGSRARGNHGKQSVAARGGRHSGREDSQNQHHSFRNGFAGGGGHQGFNRVYARNTNAYNQSVAGKGLPVNMDIEQQQGRVSKDPFWAEKAAKSRWRLTDRPGYGYMPTTTATTIDRTFAPRGTNLSHERANHGNRFDMHGHNLQYQATTAWTEFATNATKSTHIDRPSIVIEKPTEQEVLRSKPVRKLRRGGALFGVI